MTPTFDVNPIRLQRTLALLSSEEQLLYREVAVEGLTLAEAGARHRLPLSLARATLLRVRAMLASTLDERP